MWRAWLISFVIVASGMSLPAQNPQPEPPPQSARQALIEMFMGKGADDFTKHLPDEARRTLIHKGDTAESSILLKISMIGRDVASQGGNIETFDSGPNILVREDPNSHEKIEVAVERDSMMGEEDEIELSIHLYKDGEPQSLPVVPQLVFTMKQEKEVWRLTEITAAAHVPLTDPDYLKNVRKELDHQNESAVRGRVMMIAQAQTRYADDHKNLGYACTLANLFPSAQSGETAAYFCPTFANEESDGYHFTLSGCNGTPAAKYRLLAVPLEADSEMKAFCVDESGTIKSIAADKKSSCFSRGEVEMNTPPLGSVIQ